MSRKDKAPAMKSVAKKSAARSYSPQEMGMAMAAAPQMMSAAVAAPRAPPREPDRPLPPFRDVINMQTSTGNWPVEAKSILTSCIAGDEGNLERHIDQGVMKQLTQKAG